MGSRLVVCLDVLKTGLFVGLGSAVRHNSPLLQLVPATQAV